MRTLLNGSSRILSRMKTRAEQRGCQTHSRQCVAMDQTSTCILLYLLEQTAPCQDALHLEDLITRYGAVKFHLRFAREDEYLG